MSAPGDHVAKLPRVRGHRVARFLGIHLLLAAFVHHARDVGDDDVLLAEPHRDDEVEARKRSRAGAGDDELHLADVLADDLQPIGNRGADDDGGAVLVVVEYRNLHPLAQGAFDVEAFRRLDVLEIDAAESGFERRDDLDQLRRIALIDLDVENVDARRTS